VATREYKHPTNGKVGEFTDAVAERFGFVPVDAEPLVIEATPGPEGDSPVEDNESEGE
jgi:hypothetical protein